MYNTEPVTKNPKPNSSIISTGQPLTILMTRSSSCFTSSDLKAYKLGSDFILGPYRLVDFPKKVCNKNSTPTSSSLQND